MALIPNFPQNLNDMHHHWHEPSQHPGAPGGRVHPFGTTGAGREFLQFHHDYMLQFRAWYDAQPFGTAPFNVAPFKTAVSAMAAVAGWTSVPAALKNGAVTGWGSVQAAQEARLSTLMPAFASEDDLGSYIEGGIHGWIHGAAASAFGEPIVGTFHSPQSTYFYGIHGLVDYWWTKWKNTQKRPIKDILDNKSFSKDFSKESKELIKEHKEFAFEGPVKNFKEKDKDKDLVEGGGFPGGGGDPFTVLNAGPDLQQRVADLETRIGQQVFITAAERPAVGQAAHQHDAETPHIPETGENT